MSEPQSPLDRALDVLLYAPVGLALTAAEELPKMAAKGRTQITNRINIARMVGQFAVTQGRKELEKRWDSGGTRRPARPSPPVVVPDPVDDPAGEPATYDEMLGGAPIEERPGSGGPGARTGPRPGREGAVATNGPGTAASNGAVPSRATGWSSRGQGGEAAGLAIPGYDSLSASQVVQRLAGLSGDELAAVGAYESAHRARRTVLTRVSQLQNG